MNNGVKSTSTFFKPAVTLPLRNYDSLVRYIQKNTAIPNALASHSQEKALLLKNAIQNADFQNAIFSDPDCYVLLLALLKNQELPFTQIITIFLYLNILIQYSNRQQFKPEDVSYKYPILQD